VIKASGRSALGEPLLLLGLSGENVARLAAGEPIAIPSAQGPGGGRAREGRCRGGSVTARSVTVYRRQRDGQWAVGLDAAVQDGEACGEIRCSRSAVAAVIARKLNEALTELADGDGPLVLKPDEFGAAKHVHGVLYGGNT
jgi:hypothetical protein